MNIRLVPQRLASVALFAAIAAGCGEGDAARSRPPESADSGLVTESACSSDATYFANGDVARGSSGALRALLVSAAPPAPAKFLNVWTLELQTTDGAAAGDAEVTKLETFMPVHGHPGQPDAAAEPMSQEGRYRAELHFTMRGPWEVRLDVASPTAGSDHIVFQVCVGG